MRYEIVVDVSKKNNKQYAYINLGYRKEFISLQLVSELLQVPYVSLFYTDKTVVGYLDVTKVIKN